MFRLLSVSSCYRQLNLPPPHLEEQSPFKLTLLQFDGILKCHVQILLKSIISVLLCSVLSPKIQFIFLLFLCNNYTFFSSHVCSSYRSSYFLTQRWRAIVLNRCIKKGHVLVSVAWQNNETYRFVNTCSQCHTVVLYS